MIRRPSVLTSNLVPRPVPVIFRIIFGRTITTVPSGLLVVEYAVAMAWRVSGGCFLSINRYPQRLLASHPNVLCVVSRVGTRDLTNPPLWIASLPNDYFKPQYSRLENALRALRVKSMNLSQLKTELGLKTASGLHRDLRRLERASLVIRRNLMNNGHWIANYSLTKEGLRYSLRTEVREWLGFQFEFSQFGFDGPRIEGLVRKKSDYPKVRGNKLKRVS